MKYNYLESVKADVKEYIENEVDFQEWKENREGLEEELNDSLWVNDSVTGNASGSYFCNTWKAEEALNHNWDEIENAAREFEYDPVISSDGYEYGAEWWDITIRCYYLNSAIYEALDEYEAAGAFEAETEEAPETLADIAASIASGIVKGTEPEASTEPVNA